MLDSKDCSSGRALNIEAKCTNNQLWRDSVSFSLYGLCHSHQRIPPSISYTCFLPPHEGRGGLLEPLQAVIGRREVDSLDKTAGRSQGHIGTNKNMQPLTPVGNLELGGNQRTCKELRQTEEHVEHVCFKSNNFEKYLLISINTDDVMHCFSFKIDKTTTQHRHIHNADNQPIKKQRQKSDFLQWSIYIFWNSCNLFEAIERFTILFLKHVWSSNKKVTDVISSYRSYSQLFFFLLLLPKGSQGHT